MAAAKKKGLGKGLDALFADMAPVDIETDTGKAKDGASETVVSIDIDKIKPNSSQPRKTFDPEALEDLANSIKEHGIIQPIIVRPVKKGYEIVAGERRYRAARKAELKNVPCIVRELTDRENMLLAIVENMQREDLNPIEEAEGLNQMIKTYGLTQEQVSKNVGKSRPYISNSLRLLKLPKDIRQMMEDGVLSAGHGRALLGMENPEDREKLARKIVEEGLSVRETEQLAANGLGGKRKRSPRKPKNPDLAKVESNLKEALGTRVNIKYSGKKGKIELEFFSREELERLIEMLESLGK